VDLSAVAGIERLLPDAYLSANGRDITPAFLEYARPLIGAPLPPAAVLRQHKVARRLPAWQA